MKKRLIIIGGVAAGPKAAAKAKRCDPNMEVVIYQEEGEISYSGCGLPYYVGGVIPERKKLLIKTAEQFSQDGIQVLKRHRVEHIDLKERRISGLNLDTGRSFVDIYDRLVLATGSEAIRPKVPGLELQNVFQMHSIYDADAILGKVRSPGVKNVVVVGGGYIGLEMTEALSVLGIKVTIVELASQIATLFDEDIAGILQQYLEKKGITVFTSEGLEAIAGKNGKVCRVQTPRREIPAEAVLLSLGVRPRVDLARQAGLKTGETGAIWVNEYLETSTEGVYAAGDCAETSHLITGKKTWVPLGSTANKQGRVAGINVCGGHSTFPGVLGTAIFKVFDFHVAKTGLNMKEAAREGFEPVQAIVRGYGRAHILPGGRESVLKIVADQKTGRILGAQALGEGPSDKFIDTVAMALHGKMTCSQLAMVDLAYSPPFSPALSPVIVAANVLLNKLEGNLEWLSAAEVKGKMEIGDDNFAILDVRDLKEVQEKRIPGSIWIPMEELEKRLGELDQDKELAVHCHSGVRSYKTCLKLKHRGFARVKNVDGGLLCWCYGLERKDGGDEPMAQHETGSPAPG
jgi:NADPH-dependent 2,4-dienoyl-CoA reductase/sulfur reductase-like enzyme/rhodanese-related sulfurtransferase